MHQEQDPRGPDIMLKPMEPSFTFCYERLDMKTEKATFVNIRAHLVLVYSSLSIKLRKCFTPW